MEMCVEPALAYFGNDERIKSVYIFIVTSLINLV